MDLRERGGRGGGEALEFDDEGFGDGGCGWVTAGGEEEAREEEAAHGGDEDWQKKGGQKKGKW